MLTPAFQIYKTLKSSTWIEPKKAPEVKENRNLSFNSFLKPPYCCIPNMMGYNFHNQHPFNQLIQSLAVLARNKEQ